MKRCNPLLSFLLLVAVSQGQVLVQNEKPVDDPASSSLESCSSETDELLSIQEVLDARLQITTQFEAVNIQQKCIPGPSDYRCLVDYAEFAGDHDLQKACESNQGQYLERHHRIVCPTKQRQHVMTVHNVPLCFAKICQDADIERLVAQSMRELENSLSESLGVTCTSQYDIENDEDASTCPSPVNASSETCGPLAPYTDGQLCGCYTFCDNIVVSCQESNTLPPPIACGGKVVSGCTYALFDDASDSLRMAATTSSSILMLMIIAIATLFAC